jgi:hypothetical protein
MTAGPTTVEALAAGEAAKALMGRYAYYIDAGYDLDGLGSLLTEDFVWDGNIAPLITSRDEFLEFQGQNTSDIKWAFHIVNPLFVDVPTPEHASGTWHILGLHTMVDKDDADGRVAVFYTGSYDCEFVKREDGWRISRMKLAIHHLSQLSKGWVEEPFYWSRAEA